ncbi:calcium-dependent kinase CDPK6 [Babesia ovis]|uniref:Calcium-dependent kinase CDPK6 n=1 Tax=Babesia ovis TaxID=5869 RepID=A0A9W5TBF4_BABOV|nr:calcium-dependent kinase CDPK6 [Babesia ovis]
MEQRSGYEEAVSAFKSLVTLKQQVISALQNEWDYAIRECDAIFDFCKADMSVVVDGQDSSKGSIQTDPHSLDSESRNISLDSDCNDEQRVPLLMWQSKEQKELEQRWNSQLKKCIECLRKDTAKSSRANSVSIEEVEAIYHSIEQLKNAYFQVVEERENNNKLWLRLKMYSYNRRKTIEKVCKPYGTIKRALEAMQRKETRSITRDHTTQRTLKTASSLDNQGFGGTKYVERGIPGPSNNASFDVLSDGSRGPSIQNEPSLMECSPNLEEFITQTSSIDLFYNNAMHIYTQYGDGRMTLKMFNNLVDYLLNSLGIPGIDKAAFKKIFDLYGVESGTIITKEVFVPIYWEITHIIRNAIDVMQCLNGQGLRGQPQGAPTQDSKTFVDITEHFEFKKKLYSGRSCTKFLATDLNTGEMRVVDILHKSDKIPPFEQLSSEISRLAKLQRQNLALYINAYHDLNNIYIISEYCSGGSLLQNITFRHENSYTMEFVHVVVAQVIEAVLYLHCNNIVHGSLTIDKVMLQENDYNHVKLRDAGLSGLVDVDIRGSKLTTLCTAPEVKEGRTTLKSDIWSIGVILAFLTTGIIPLERGTYEEYITAVKTHLKNGRIFKYDPNLRDLVTKMVSLDPNDRPDAFQIITHPWYTHSGYAGQAPGHFKVMSQPIRRLNAIKQTHVDIIRVLEAQNSLYVYKIAKLVDTLQLVKRLKNDKITPKDFSRVMQMEGLEPQMVDNISMIIMCGRETISLDDFLSALTRWKFGIIALAWSEFHKNAQEGRCSMKAVDFARFLTNTRSQLVPREEVARVCNNLAINQSITWTDFVKYLG